MTSIPASRSARAMIFAPRSCPSRPGFAITTLIFPAIAVTLEDRRLAPDAPDLPERVAHLAERHECARAHHDRVHEIRVALRGPLELGERILDGGRVAVGTHGAHPLDLLALERGIDAEDLERQLVLELVAVDADDDALAALHLRLVAVRRLGDLPLHEVLLDRGDDAAELLDPVEVLVGLPLEFVR